MITLNYLSHNRRSIELYWQINSYFLNKIKPENKSKIKLNILATKNNDDWEKYAPEDIETTLILFDDKELNYIEKIHHIIEDENNYVMKWDEDCFIGNHVWDYIIENIDCLDDEQNLLISPLLSHNIPLVDIFSETFILEEKIKKELYSYYKNRSMPNGIWLGVNYEPLNEYTIYASKWNSENYYNGLEQLPTLIKGIHPVRISAEAQFLINKYILKNIHRMFDKHDYKIREFKSPYFTTSAFAIKTKDFRNILNMDAYDSFDEIQLNNYRRKTNKKFLFVENGFSIHTMFNTICGYKKNWEIGVEDEYAYKYEKEFVENVLREIKS